MSERLDRALAQRGLVKSRTEAARRIDAGEVTVNGKTATRASQQVTDADVLAVAESDGFVSRAAAKLVAAIETFDVPVAGRTVLDLGASTGGFTQVCLREGAGRVVALDVGHDQLDARIRADARVTVVEGENARYLTAARLTELVQQPNETTASSEASNETMTAADIDLVVGDLSFISLRHILPAIRASVVNLRDAILLVKPQFEVGRTGVRGGIVSSDDAAVDAVCEVIGCAREVGFTPRSLVPSPITGTHGNREYLLWLQPHPPATVDGGTDSSTARSADHPANLDEIPAAWEPMERYVRKIVGRPIPGGNPT